MSDDLTTAVADAIRLNMNWTRFDPEDGSTAVGWNEPEHIASAAIAAIAAQGDVTDSAIEQPFLDRILFIGGPGEGVPTNLRNDVAKCVFMGAPAELIEAVHALLAQATAPLHARIAALERKIAWLERSYRAEDDATLARAEAAEATVERVRVELPPKELCTPFQRRVLAALADQKGESA